MGLGEVKMSYKELEKRFAELANRLPDPDSGNLVCDVPCLEYTSKEFVACSSGTAALHLSLELLRLEKFGYNERNPIKVAIPDFSMIAIPRAVVLADMMPVLVDCGDDLNIDEELLMSAIEIEECDIAIVVDTYGVKFKSKSDLDIPIIYDMSELHGFSPRVNSEDGNPFTVWSFYKNKVIGGEEGGMIFCDSKRKENLESLKCLGFTKAHDFKHLPRGHNYRLADSLANLIIESIENYDSNLERRIHNENLYEGVLSKLCETPSFPRDSPWVFHCFPPRKLNQDWVVSEINKIGLTCRHFFKPISDQEEFKFCPKITRNPMGETKAGTFSKRGVYIDLWQTPSPEQIEKLQKILGI